MPLAMGPSPSITGVPTQDFSRKRARKNTPAEHHQYELSPRRTPPPEPCERERRAGARPRRALLPSQMALASLPTTHLRQCPCGAAESPNKQKVWEETRLPAHSHSTATSVGQSTSGEGFCPRKDHLEVRQGKKKELTREEESNSHVLLTASKNLTHPTTSFIEQQVLVTLKYGGAKGTQHWESFKPRHPACSKGSKLQVC